MHWSEEELAAVVRRPIDGEAHELGSPVVAVETDRGDGEVVPRERREGLLERGFDHAPVRPYETGQYYDVTDDALRPVADDQYVAHDRPILACLNVLTGYEFALVTHPDPDAYLIVTPADLNGRVAHEYLYPFFAEGARAVSDLLESRFGTDELTGVYREARNKGDAVTRYERARESGLELHVAEFMNLTDLKEVTAELTAVRTDLGLDSKTQCRARFDAVARYRDRVMHANRTLVDSREDIEGLATAIDAASYLTESARALVD